MAGRRSRAPDDIRAGAAPQQIVGTGAVVIDRCVFVHSWRMKARSWRRTFA